MLDKDGNLTQKNIQCSNKRITTPLQKIEFPNESCFVSSTFAVIRQTQNRVPKSINSTLTRFFSSILFLFC